MSTRTSSLSFYWRLFRIQVLFIMIIIISKWPNGNTANHSKRKCRQANCAKPTLNQLNSIHFKSVTFSPECCIFYIMFVVCMNRAIKIACSDGFKWFNVKKGEHFIMKILLIFIWIRIESRLVSSLIAYTCETELYVESALNKQIWMHVRTYARTHALIVCMFRMFHSSSHW